MFLFQPPGTLARARKHHASYYGGQASPHFSLSLSARVRLFSSRHSFIDIYSNLLFFSYRYAKNLCVFIFIFFLHFCCCRLNISVRSFATLCIAKAVPRWIQTRVHICDKYALSSFVIIVIVMVHLWFKYYVIFETLGVYHTAFFLHIKVECRLRMQHLFFLIFSELKRYFVLDTSRLMNRIKKYTFLL